MESDLEYTPKKSWDKFCSEQEREMIFELADRYLDFLSQCKNERKTVEWVREKALQAGFTEDVNSPRFLKLAKNKTVLLARKWRKPFKQGVRLLGAHADTPRLDFKQFPLHENSEVAMAKTHYYGGIRKHQWFSRALALHGVVVKTDGSSVDINIGDNRGDPVFVIADLLPHLASKQNEQTVSKAFEAEKMNVILGNSPLMDNQDENAEGGNSNEKEKNKIKKHVLQLLFDKYGIREEDLYSAEIHAVPAGNASYVGLDKSLLGGYGHDDRICVFCGLEAMLREDDPEYNQVVIFWDKEEIGSEGATGARSYFMEYCLQDLLDAWEPGTKLSEVFEAAKAVSADVHGGLDPDYQDLHDQLNASKLGYGPVFSKFTGHRGKLGANDATAEYVAWFRNLLNNADIPWQMAELGKVDMGGGGTVAKFLAMYGMDIIDFGPSVLGMHSPFEITSTADLYATYLAYSEFLKA
ncbi:MAG: aminopeptidase [Thermodesulfobacteriota bacterium]